MSGKSNKTKIVQVRIPNKEFYDIEDYAKKHSINRSQAIIKLLRKSLYTDSETVTKSDLMIAVSMLEKFIADQPIHVQLQPEQETKLINEINEKKSTKGFFSRIFRNK